MLRVLTPGGVLLTVQTTLARLSVVVPVGPGDTVAPRLERQLLDLALYAQVVVVHAHAAASPTQRAAPDAAVRWHRISAPPGRALQQNAGARAAVREWIWFLHADSELAPDTLPALECFVDQHPAAMGYFDLRFLNDGPALMPLNAMGAWVRSRVFGLPFGDQGLLMSRATFERLGGFDANVACGEDHDLVWRARCAGVPLRAVGAPLFTSGRKYAEQGWWSTTATHLRATLRQARQFSRAARAP